MIDRTRARCIAVEKAFPPFRHVSIHKIGSRFGQTYHIGSKESRNHRHSHHNRIEEMTGHIQRNTQRGNNKSKLTNLCQTESALHGCLQRLSRQQNAQCAKQRLSDNHRQCNDQNRNGIFNNHTRIDHHTYRHEKDSSEQVLYRFYQLLDVFCL